MRPPLAIQFSSAEREELLAALAAAMRSLIDERLICLDEQQSSQLDRHRRCLCRFYWRLSREERGWANEDEITLLGRCQILLRIFAARLTGRPRQNVERLARQLTAAIGRREGYEEFWGE